MATKFSSSLALFFILNLLFFVLATSCGTCPTPPKPKPKPKPTPAPCPSTPTPSTPTPPTPSTPTPPTPPTPSGKNKCPIDTLKLGVCADILGLINLNLGGASNTPCCSLLGNLANLDAAVCLCTTLKAGILGINLNIPLDLSLLLNYCGKSAPSGFQCK